MIKTARRPDHFVAAFNTSQQMALIWCQMAFVRLESDRKTVALIAVNELAMNLPPAAVNDRYFEVLIIPQALIAKVLCKLFTVLDGL
jgi:hypothetical protein